MISSKSIVFQYNSLILRSQGRLLGVKIDIKWLRIVAWLLDGCRKFLEWLLERSRRAPEPKKVAWRPLGAVLER